ncbi:putative small protein [Thalassovita gelatinovora]|uniref:Putative small protein n=1 Tax=Thalassovita gelatinovora TaxID=53501 RepID=A0A0P1FIT1_THAGE|nr:DUF1150 family protein [Thalassovita gelatinovora]QIZ81521.1 DUF1150 family protein [Thalassovita gelatinovora]CUH67901.1 putative small protein [Thalassovita gelatinovora]SEQ25168.1 hypothetical protein SAMN04488043_104143 [Thalassovita gelatinovora]
MDTQYDFGQDDDNQIVYVRSVKVADLPKELQAQAGTMDQVYAVCTEDGERLALVENRKLAFLLARQHDYEPVTVH